MIASVLQEAGFKTGLYSSPHLLDFRERIKIDGLMIPKQEVVEFVFNNKTFFEKNKFSFFEMTVGMAFWYFSKKKLIMLLLKWVWEGVWMQQILLHLNYQLLLILD